MYFIKKKKKRCFGEKSSVSAFSICLGYFTWNKKCSYKIRVCEEAVDYDSI